MWASEAHGPRKARLLPRHHTRSFVKLLILALITSLLTLPCSAQGLYTELGLGVRLTNYSSYLENPLCKKAIVTEPLWPDNPRGGSNPGAFSCGGDEPIFVGDILGWEFRNGQTVSLCHKSQWFDGNGELYWTGVCTNYRIYWRKFKRK